MKKTSFTPTMKDFKRDWHLIDAENEILGRISTKIAKLLMGKNKAIFTPNECVGDINASKIKVTGKKMKDKTYFHHTGFPKGLRSENLESLFARRPAEVLIRSVKGMLPKNKLRNLMIKNFYVYAGSEHPHQNIK
jgi:large subunit ribosomal protein L13